MKENLIRTRSFDFGITVIRLYQKLIAEKEFVLSKQLLRSATSVGANVEEASGAQSRRDFLSKMSIASKEARETVYWLRLYKASGLTKIDVSQELAEAQELANILAAIVRSTQKTI